MKRFVALSLVVLLAIGFVLPVMADDAEDLAAVEVMADDAAPLFVDLTGKVTDLGEDAFTVEDADGNATVIKFDSDTFFLDATTGDAMSIDDLDEGDTVKVFHSSVMTRSIPPQTNAIAVALSPEGLNAPIMWDIEKVEATDDGVKLTVDNGGLILNLNEDIALSHLGLTREAMTLEKIGVGDRMLFWYAFVGMSMPAQATPTKAVWLSEGDFETPVTLPAELGDGDVAVTPAPPVTTAVPPIFIGPIPGAGVMRDGVEFFPVREIAEKLGYTVDWNNEAKRAEINMPGTAKIVNIYPGKDTVDLNRAIMSLSAPVFIENGRMYAPQDFFDLLG